MKWREIEREAQYGYDTYKEVFGVMFAILTWPIWGPIVMIISCIRRKNEMER